MVDSISVNQILTHWYATILLSLCYSLHQAKEFVISGQIFEDFSSLLIKTLPGQNLINVVTTTTLAKN